MGVLDGGVVGSLVGQNAAMALGPEDGTQKLGLGLGAGDAITRIGAGLVVGAVIKTSDGAGGGKSTVGMGDSRAIGSVMGFGVTPLDCMAGGEVEGYTEACNDGAKEGEEYGSALGGTVSDADGATVDVKLGSSVKNPEGSTVENETGDMLECSVG